MIKISENGEKSLKSLFEKYHECVYWGQCEDSYRSQLLLEIKKLLWMNPGYVEEQVAHYFNNLQWRDVQKDKGQLEDLIIAVQLIKINILISQNKLKFAHELLKEMPENEEIDSLRQKVLTKIAIEGDEDLIISILNEGSDIHPDFRSEAYRRAISGAIPSLAASLLIINDMIIPPGIKASLVNVIENGVGWEPALRVLSHMGVRISENDRKKLFNKMMNSAGSNVQIAQEALRRIDKIPRMYARKLKKILRNKKK